MDHFVRPEIKTSKIYNIRESGGGWPLDISNCENWAWKADVLNKNEIASIIRMFNSLNFEDGTTMAGVDSNVRNSLVHFIYPNPTTEWLFQKITSIVCEMNSIFFGFDLYGLDQGIQLTKYIAPGQHYDWHIDKGFGNRKLSLTIQLSEPDSYEGGNLELWHGGEPSVVSRELGMAAVFPSYVMHRVSPVTKGERYSLVCWVSGPRFK